MSVAEQLKIRAKLLATLQDFAQNILPKDTVSKLQ